MNGSEILKSSKAALGAAAILSVFYFLSVLVFTLVSGRNASGLWSAAFVFAAYGVAFAAALLLVVVPVLQIRAVRRLGAAASLPLAVLLSLVTAVLLSLRFGDGDDPSSVAAILANWGRNPLPFLVGFTPFLVASAAFAWFQRRAERL
ncbi:MAG: hypothetical protein U0X73_07920 [Thermoanaerobaculia bacterium]